MGYKYITANNLEEIQTYMYSEFFGMDFLKEYAAVRKEYIIDKQCFFHIELLNSFILSCSPALDNQTFFDLKLIVHRIQQNEFNDVFSQINMFQKRFEVKKRLFYRYEDEKISGARGPYDDLNSYILLSSILLQTYFMNKKLSYLSTTIKINDTILSNYSLLGNESKKIVSGILNTELYFINNLYESKGLCGSLI